jgi:hypothetical protein
VEGTPLNEIDFYQFIENRIACVNIEDFAIEGAEIELTPHLAKRTELTLSLLNINLLKFKAAPRSYKEPARVLSSEALTLQFARLELNHKDNIHRLAIENLRADTRSNMISTDKVSFRPISNKRNRDDVTYIDVESKSLELKGFSFLDAYHRQIFPMKELAITQPRVVVSLKTEQQTKKQRDNESLLLEKINAYIRGIYVDNTRIEQGFLEYSNHSSGSDNGFFRTHFRFNLSKLSLDSATFYQTDKLFFARDFNILFTKSGLNLGEKLHEITADSIHLSSQGRTVNLVNLEIRPTISNLHPDTLAKFNRTELYSVMFPNIYMSGANLHHAFFNKELYISNIDIAQPTIRFEKYGKWANSPTSKAPTQNELFSLFSDFLHKIKIWEMNMTNGTIHFSQHNKGKSAFEFTNQFNIRFVNFELDSLSSSRSNKLFFADDIDLTLRDQSFAMADGIHKLNAKEIGILSSQDQIFIRDAELIPDLKSEQFKKAPVAFVGKIPLIEANGADIPALFSEGKFPVKSLQLTNPDIEILFQSEVKKSTSDSVKMPMLLPKGFEEMSIANIKVNQGRLKLRNLEQGSNTVFASTSFNFAMSGLKVSDNNKEVISEYKNFNISMENTQFDMPDKINSLTIGKISYEQNESNLMVENIKIKPTPGVTSKKHEPLELSIPHLLLSNFNFDQFLDEKKLIGKRLVLTNPLIVSQGKSNEEITKTSFYRLNLYSKINHLLQGVDVAEVEVVNGQLTSNKPDATKYTNITIKGSGFKIDKELDEKQRLLNFDKVELEIPDIKGKTKGGYYEYRVERIKVNSSGMASVQNFSLKPVFSREEHFIRKQYQDDYFNLEPSNIQISGLDLYNLLENDKWIANKAIVNFTNVSIFRDKRLAIHPNKFAKLPQQALRDLKQDVTIDTLYATCKQLTYSERESGTLSEGMVFFNPVEIRANNITNISEQLRKKPKANLDFDGKFMGEGQLMVKMELDLGSKSNDFSFEAHMAEMPLSLANPITEPGLKLSIKEGINRDMKVYFVANEDSSTGRMLFKYNDLKISVLSTKKGEVKEEKFLSFLANTLAVKSDNPKHGTEPEPAYFNYQRDKQRSVINFCWKSVFAGMKSTLGLKEKEDKK